MKDRWTGPKGARKRQRQSWGEGSVRAAGLCAWPDAEVLHQQAGGGWADGP